MLQKEVKRLKVFERWPDLTVFTYRRLKIVAHLGYAGNIFAHKLAVLHGCGAAMKHVVANAVGAAAHRARHKRGNAVERHFRPAVYSKLYTAAHFGSDGR